MKRESKITDLLALMVLAVFAVCILMVLLSGARAYSRMLDNGEAGFQRRTGAHYIATRVRQAKSASVAEFEGCSALVIPETIEGEMYTTMVYWFDGYIRELFCEAGAALYPEDGEMVLRSEPVAFSEEGGMILARIGSDELRLHLPWQKEIPL